MEMLILEFIDFLKDNKKWWLYPILIMIGLFGIVIAYSSSDATTYTIL